MFEDKNLILASGSPRRKYLLRQAGIPFIIRKEQVEEHFPAGLSPREAPEYLAEKKAAAIHPECSDDEVILAADTMVLLGDRIMDKPPTRKAALSTLAALSGKMHEVVTGVCLLQGKRRLTFSEVTRVFFRNLKEEQIIYYVDTFHPLDKAGGYAIQEWIGLMGIEKIEGDYFNVVGLPIGRVIEELERW